jgi:alanine racemase
MLAGMPRPIRATIDLAALGHNLARARAQAGGRKVWAVVKANAYGHGIERALRAFAAADGLAVLDLDEAQRARDAGWLKPILLLEGFFEPRDLGVVEALNLTSVVHQADQVDMLAAYRPGRPLDLYIKLNTGMNRLGFGADAMQVVNRLQSQPLVRVAALMMHFANADRPQQGPADVVEQLNAFTVATHGWRGAVSLANSAALFLRPDVRGDSVRPGIALYGASPQAGLAAARLGLRPAMLLRSRILAVQKLRAGDAVGYGSRWIAQRASRIGVVACGYADGYPRVAPDGTPVWVAGSCVALIGRVSMDMITVDLTNTPHAEVGAEVELWGEHVPIDEVAERAGTVGYELMCALARRVPVDETG